MATKIETNSINLTEAVAKASAINTEIDTQADLISQIKTALEGKSVSSENKIQVAVGELNVGVVSDGTTAVNVNTLGFTPKYVHMYASSSVYPSSVNTYYLVSASVSEDMKTCQYAIKTSSTGTPTIYNRSTTSYPYMEIQDGGFKFTVTGFSLRCGTVKYVAIG